MIVMMSMPWFGSFTDRWENFLTRLWQVVNKENCSELLYIQRTLVLSFGQNADIYFLSTPRFSQSWNLLLQICWQCIPAPHQRKYPQIKKKEIIYIQRDIISKPTLFQLWVWWQIVVFLEISNVIWSPYHIYLSWNIISSTINISYFFVVSTSSSGNTSGPKKKSNRQNKVWDKFGGWSMKQIWKMSQIRKLSTSFSTNLEFPFYQLQTQGGTDQASFTIWVKYKEWKPIVLINELCLSLLMRFEVPD